MRETVVAGDHAHLLDEEATLAKILHLDVHQIFAVITGENKGEPHGGENSRQSVPLLETEEEPNTDERETQWMECSESDDTIGVELLERDIGVVG